MRFLVSALVLLLASASALAPVNFQALKSMVAKTNFNAMNATTCTAAASTLFETMSSCDLYSFDGDKLGNLTYVQGFCGASCLTDVLNSFAAVKTECSPLIASDSKDISSEFINALVYNINNFRFFTDAVCAKETGGDYCYPNLFQAIRNLDGVFNGNVTLTEANLNSYCSPCIYKIAANLYSVWTANGETGNVATLKRVLNMLCTRSITSDEYCLNPFLKFLADAKKETFTGSSVCSPCVVRSLQSFNDGSFDNVISDINNNCDRNEEGKYCVDLSQQLSTLGPEALTACANSNKNTCEAGCQAKIDTLVGTLGCCFANFKNSNDDISGAVAALSACNWGSLKTCGVLTRKTARVVFNVTNIKASYYSRNKNQLDAGLKSDIALAAGVLPQNVVLNSSVPDQSAPLPSVHTSVRSLAEESQVTISVDISGSYANTVAAKLVSNMDSGKTVLPTVDTVPIQGQAVPFQASSYAAASTTADPSKDEIITSGAAFASASFGLMSVLLFVLYLSF